MVKRLILGGVSPINPDGFHVGFGIVVDDVEDIRSQLILIDDISNQKFLCISFSELLTSRHIPDFAVDSSCFWDSLSAKVIWQDAAAMAFIDLQNPKVKFSCKGESLVVTLSFGRYLAKTKISFAEVSGFLKKVDHE
ncbi:MAG: hypothetical protein A2312_00560 [Candidatus Staskawiczbacteria bacterium RIFOXYB2_FULL_32_9]|uniref:Uncharacterized protein n=1 Tax=Candidatus Staskawiczbacteria bacterium RIFOXYD1_FULL_32_13 TaxID=1802234 RepID=A0A1G2JK42_9BACT|nr:MAG: hypothetical protein A2360_02635 [Candidatus Staskawiczbacteria bacterium RIFOXYB1_FULL_32_11]OGZ79797.1 MAG: hypothetical protein A2256_00670 [Candidatus Staskawiczbacteria bacterium RIFOXYA2_FULL_32_7]OGZ84422.1 MAG: hypothetical protein A2312_00560 [Candidatus Staskawiczbacteria bacterium RIFOXYB2_FULL_32_9]OGZ87495.1 MAG: hypothetical protein A2561_00695 [Candidatus Staskawiczbacteria bacterium RIFOXYD1_FULL_32_13]OGZ88115.1 MAG: hypothetical protein A2463_02095 [Candidatus Staskawi